MSSTRLTIYFGVLISITSIWISFSNVDFIIVGESLSNAHSLYSFPLILTLFFYYYIKAIRWKYLLQPLTETNSKTIFPSMMIGFLGNNILPARLGEFIRMYLGAKTLNLKYSQVLATLALERLLDFLTIVLFIAVIVTIENYVPILLIQAGIIATIIGGLLLFAFMYYARHTVKAISITRRILFFLPKRLKHIIVNQLEIGAEGLQSLHNARLLAKIIISSIAQWILMALTIYISVAAVNVTLPFSSAFIVLAFTVFAVMIPAAPGFFGTIQLAFILSLTPLGVTNADAISASIIFHLLSYFFVLAVGFYFLKHFGYSINALKKETEAAEHEI